MKKAYNIENIERLIYSIRGRKIMLDADLARIYGVTTARLNQQVKRNLARFPEDFAFRLTKNEYDTLMLQFATSKAGTGRGGRRKLPYVFTEHGAIMAANVLNSLRASQMSVYIVRVFVRMRSGLVSNRALAQKLADLEKELKQRLDVHESAIVDILRRVVDIIEAPPSLPDLPKKKIGFHLEETVTHYMAPRKGKHLIYA